MSKTYIEAPRFWVDTETTGLSPRKNFAFEMSYLIEENGIILCERTLRMCPKNYNEFEFSHGAEKVHGWTREAIIALSSEEDALTTLVADIKEHSNEKLVIAGYNIIFDVNFIKAFLLRAAPSADNFYYQYFFQRHFDVMQFAHGFAIGGAFQPTDFQLCTLCKYFDISVKGAHTSLIDVKNTFAVYKKLLALNSE